MVKPTCKIANLCISPVHAGIIPFNTANSSFILDLRRRSIRLCAVFLAIFRPAALVADGCFFLDGGPASFAADAAAAAVLFPAPFPLAVVAAVGAGAAWASGALSSCSDRGFIWMILRDLVGGGGRTKALLLLLPPSLTAAAEERLLDLTTSLGCMGYAALGDIVETGETGLKLAVAWARLELWMAGSGSSKVIWREERCLVPSLAWMSVEEAGVGGSAARGMVVMGAAAAARRVWGGK